VKESGTNVNEVRQSGFCPVSSWVRIRRAWIARLGVMQVGINDYQIRTRSKCAACRDVDSRSWSHPPGVYNGGNALHNPGRMRALWRGFRWRKTLSVSKPLCCVGFWMQATDYILRNSAAIHLYCAKWF